MSEQEQVQPVERLKTPWPEVLLAALPAALHAVILLGRLHADEVFQILEPAMQRAFGYGVLSWEWQVGLRNVAIPVVFSWLLKGAAAVGLNDVLARRVVLEVPQYFLHAAMLGAVWRLFARRIGPKLARWGLWAMVFYGPLMWFGGRTLSESFSVAFLVIGLERLDVGKGARWWVPFIGGLCLGLAEITRYGSAAVIVPAMLWLLVTRQWRNFALATVAGLLMAVFLGWIDLVSWGDWFHSFRAYLNFNVISGQAAAQFGTLPGWFYFQRFILAPWAPIGFVAWKARKDHRLWLFLVAGAGYFAIVSATPHKEDRFVYPSLILLSIAATPAFIAWVQATWPRTRTQVLTAIVVAGSVAFYVIKSPWEPDRKEQFQLEVQASRGATGLVIMNEGMWGSGGYFYLGKELPWCPCDFPRDPCFQMAARDARFNRGLYWRNSLPDPARDEEAKRAFESAGFHLVTVKGQASLFARDSTP